jgi:predicted enzyme related to lactoylglutathione lyase
MGRPVVHWEFWTPDAARLGEFYARVFDWQPRRIPEIDYTLVNTGGEGGIHGGMMTPKQGPWPAKLSLYIDVDDLAPFCQRIRDAGGKVLVERQEVPGVGSFALFEDPEGRVLGMWQQNRPPAGSS